MRGQRGHHSHGERPIFFSECIDHRLQRLGTDRVPGLASGPGLHITFHCSPHLIRHGDGIAVQIQGHRRDDMGIRVIIDDRVQGLPWQHLRTVQFTTEHTVEQYLPIRLSDQLHLQAFIFEVAKLIGHG